MLQMRCSARPALEGTALQTVLTALDAVDEQVAPGSFYRHDALPALSVFCTLAGTCTAAADGRPAAHRPGAVVAVARGAALEERVGARPWRVRYLMLDGPWAERVQASLAAGGLRSCALLPAPAAWRAAVTGAVGEALDRRPGWDWRLAAHLAVLGGGLAARDPGRDAGLLERAGRLVDAAPHRPWDAQSLAASLGVGVSTLGHRFQDLVGTGPVAWARRRRLERARELLAQGLGVAEAAERLGFANAFHFSRAYTRALGRNPSADRGDRVSLH